MALESKDASGPTAAPTGGQRSSGADRNPLSPVTGGLRDRALRRRGPAVRLLTDMAVPAGIGIANPELALGAVIFGTGTALSGYWFGMYRERFTQSVLAELLRLVFMVASGGALAAVGVRVVGKDHTPNVTGMGILTLVVLIIGRATIYHRDRKQRLRGQRMLGRALIVGGGAVTNELTRRICEHPELGLRPGGLLQTNPQTSIDWPVLGTPGDLPTVMAAHDIDVVIMALQAAPEGEVYRAIRSCDFSTAELYTVSPWFSLRGGHTSTADQLWGIPVTRVTPARRLGAAWRVKRLSDIVVSAVALALLSPLFAALALAELFEGGRGVIFRQVRVGLDGKLITIMKFRTMRPAAVEESDTTWSIAGDARIGPVGRVLRASSLDELPQLVNVLRGEMSLVGPRPERPHFVNQYEPLVPDYRYRHRMQVGMTGYAAVQGLRGDTSIEERAYFDNLYIENWSLGLDAMILCRTVMEVLRRHGA